MECKGKGELYIGKGIQEVFSDSFPDKKNL